MNGDDHEDRIRSRAHQIWEQEGRKDGDHERHWQQALEELRGTGATGEAGQGSMTGGMTGGGMAGETGMGSGGTDDEVVVERTDGEEQRRSGL